MHGSLRSTPVRLLPLLASVAVALAPGVDDARAQTVAITGGTVVDGTGAPAVTDAVIVVRDGRLACVGTAGECGVPDDARRVDATGRWIVPGLVDGHVHYSQTGWADGRPDALDMRERFPYAETIHRLEEDPEVFGRSYLCSGVTATFDVGGYPWTWNFRAWADTSTTMPHVAAAGPLLSTRDHWVNLPAERQFVHIHDRESVEAGADYLVANGTDAVKVWFLVSQGADTANLRSMMEATARKARTAGVPLIVHATGLWQATVAVENGAHLLVHSVSAEPVDDAFLQAARRAGTYYNPTLIVGEGYTQLRARDFDESRYGELLACVDDASLEKARLTNDLQGAPDEATVRRMREGDRAEMELMAENLRRVREAGIPVVVGTDAGNPLTLHGPSIFPEMEAMAAAGMTPMEVLVAATRHGAEAMGRAGDIGTLEEGKAADLVILTGDPLTDVANLRRIEAVMRAGTLHRRETLEYR